MTLIYRREDGSWTCPLCGRPHAKADTTCECMTPRAVEDAEPATDSDLATARQIVENVPNHGFVSVPARLLARLVKRGDTRLGRVQFFAVDDLTGERTEITDLYWFEE